MCVSTSSEPPTPDQLSADEVLDLIDKHVADLTEEEIERRLQEVLRAGRMRAFLREPKTET
jgi:hypothetical protein